MMRVLVLAFILFGQFVHGQDCVNATLVGSIPFAASGTTVGFQDNYSFPASACAGLPAGGGAGAPENTYQIIVGTFTEYIFTLKPDNWDAVMYIVKDCANIATTCRGADDQGGNTDTRTLGLGPGTFYIIIDGTNGASGSYFFTVETADNHFTATYATNTLSSSAGTVSTGEPAKSNGGGFVSGQSCVHPLAVGSVPFVASGTTSTFTDYYSIPAGACPWQQGQRGLGSPDVSYSFSPNASGIYTFSLTNTSFDSVLSVVTDCNDINNNTCLEGRDNVGVGATESFALSLVTGKTYFIIVDGFSNVISSPASGTYTLSVVAGGSLTMATSASPSSVQPTSAQVNPKTSQTNIITNTVTHPQISVIVTTYDMGKSSNPQSSTNTKAAGQSTVSNGGADNEVSPSSAYGLAPLFACAIALVYLAF